MRKKLILLSFLFPLWLLLGAFTAPPHEFHMSKCQIEYNQEEKALQMTLHLFLDDLEDALKKDGFSQLHLCTEKETTEAEIHLYEYLQKNFLLKVNGVDAAYEFIGKEQSEDLIGVWVYLEITGVETVENISITNQLLIDVFADQKNITSISVPPSKQNYFILQKGKTQESINY